MHNTLTSFTKQNEIKRPPPRVCFTEKNPSLSDAGAAITDAFKAAAEKQAAKIAEARANLAKADKKFVEDLTADLQGEEVKLANIAKEQEAFLALLQAGAGVQELVRAGHSVLSEALDRVHGAEINDPAVFRAHAQRYEAEFFNEMRALNIRDPDVLTRVSEYVDKISAYVVKIIDNGFAYESNGSVYFDVQAFTKAGKPYGKLAPWSVGNERLLEDAEGALASKTSDKRSPQDFALWKGSKPGEPAWSSPWGQGRPGWHIECSAMASDVLGTNFDVHAGGEDLKFPHHDNEIAQAEAYCCEVDQWVNYFLHAGHLHIAGLKMSKSLKNFITIKQIMEHYSWRHIRMLFLLQAWDKKMNFSDGTFAEAASREHTFNEFFENVKSVQRGSGKVAQLCDAPQMWDAADHKQNEALLAAQTRVHAALCDNLDFPLAMQVLADLVNECNKYVKTPSFKVLLLSRCANYVDSILRVFGLNRDSELGFAAASAGDSESEAALLDVVSRFRDQIRSAAQAKRAYSELLELCDSLRDDVLPELGVRLEDVASGPSVWKRGEPAELIRARDEKRAQVLAKAVEKLQNQLAARQKALDKWQASAQPAEALLVAEYKCDDKGVPTHDLEGKEVTKSAAKACAKRIEKQQKANQEYSDAVAKNPSLIADLQKEIDDIKEQIAAKTAGAQ